MGAGVGSGGRCGGPGGGDVSWGMGRRLDSEWPTTTVRVPGIASS